MDLTAFQGMDLEALANLSDEQRKELIERLERHNKHYFYNRLELFNPYDYQREFMAAGANKLIRYLRAGNRTGKTYGAATEFAYHITGRYPFWWEGARIENGNHTFWAVGITLESAANVIQKELFGTADYRTEEFGSGTIPKDCIEKTGFVPDGPKIKACMIRHKSGQLNTLRFFGSENVSVMMGAKVALCWIDEEALNGMEIYTQCATRVINALGPGKNGLLMITATPERGYTPLNKLFDNDKSGLLYLQSASWDQCPHFTPEMIEQELAKYPEWQREMRRRGFPVLGTGAIFEIDDKELKLMEISPGDDWEVLGAVDWGESIDPTVLIVALRNLLTDTSYIYDEIYLKGSEYERSPKNLADIIKAKYPGLTVIVPHDHPALSQQLRGFGVNVMLQPFQNPPQSMLKIRRVDAQGSDVRDVETGLDEMRFMMQEGRLKVLQRCNKWFEEKASYYYEQNKNTGAVKRTEKNNHAIDASRYALLSLMGNRGGLWRDVFTPSNSFYSEPTSLNILF
ncbi:hypothetical protein D8V62_23780 [Salmonella enterica]|nr:hypothetical protein [Salmonella enterica]